MQVDPSCEELRINFNKLTEGLAVTTSDSWFNAAECERKARSNAEPLETCKSPTALPKLKLDNFGKIFSVRPFQHACKGVRGRIEAHESKEVWTSVLRGVCQEEAPWGPQSLPSCACAHW